MKRPWTISLMILVSTSINAQFQKFNTVLYGVAYYNEYMPYERLEKDIQLMQDAGISVVRLGESTWSLFEPEEGRFEFTWMDHIIDNMHKAGIKVILGTPTYSIPAWMAKKYPELFVERLDGSKAIRYYFNYSTTERHFVYSYDKGIELLTNKKFMKGDSLALKPWDIIIMEE